ncbi:hypothetical protein SASPL_107152 [Salvia splendens]|uniref:Fungal lipase-type domain-containing protein n=1 Tax=Salvia splendens TaxID=180675 RepID=A0A8X8YAV3_SALSN|nr:hypothetical protein SASPL_107152 [Salvia splendens]
MTKAPLQLQSNSSHSETTGIEAVEATTTNLRNNRLFLYSHFAPIHPRPKCRKQSSSPAWVEFSRIIRSLKKDDLYKKSSFILNRFHWSKADGDKLENKLENNPASCDSAASNSSSSHDELSGYNNKWSPEIAWRKALEPALQLYKWAVPTVPSNLHIACGDSCSSEVNSPPSLNSCSLSSPVPPEPLLTTCASQILGSPLIHFFSCNSRAWSSHPISLGNFLSVHSSYRFRLFKSLPPLVDAGDVSSDACVLILQVYRIEPPSAQLELGSLVTIPVIASESIHAFDSISLTSLPHASLAHMTDSSGTENKPPPTDRTLAEIFTSLQRSKLGLQEWSLSDITVGLYLIYLQQASTNVVEDVKGEIITSESIVQDLVYNIELAKGAYKDDAAALARNTEAARWFLYLEINTIRNCLEKHKGFRLRLVGHSLGGATASLLAIMLRKKSFKELGFSPDIVTAVTYGTSPCVSKVLAESCADYVTTVVMQDDIIPRLSVASLKRLRNEIVETDWVSVLSREDWRGVIDVVTNAKQVVASVQDVARKLAEYAKFRGETKYPELPIKEEIPTVTSSSQTPSPRNKSSDQQNLGKPASTVAEELYVPGTVYYLKRNVETESHDRCIEYFTLLRRQPGEHSKDTAFQQPNFSPQM